MQIGYNSYFVFFCYTILGLRITNLKWMSIDDSDSLLVGTRTLSGSFIELWRLVEKATPIHSHFKNLFQQPNKAEVFKTVVSYSQLSFSKCN